MLTIFLHVVFFYISVRVFGRLLLVSLIAHKILKSTVLLTWY